MVRHGWAIAKAEYFAQMSRFHRRRTAFIVVVTLFGVVWALIITPLLISRFLDWLRAEFEVLLMIALPGVMRAVILMLWVMVFVFPITYALQEIKIGQWEIILSHNVSTRALLFGTFVGKIPTYSLLVLFLAPVLITPFTTVFQVSVLGQALIYGVVFLVTLSTLWFSTVISTAIQAKLGESPRGKDIAKGLSIVISLVFIIPLYGLMYFAESFTAIIGLDVFQVLPFTWGADLITWTIIYYNGMNLPTAVINTFETLLGFNALFDFVLLVGFLVGMVGVGFLTADRLFHFGVGTRAEKITTVGPENMFLRGLRRLIPGPFGVLVVTSFKDFARKVQNLSQLGLGLAMAVILPIIQQYLFTNALPLFLILLVVSLIMGMFSGLVFGGIGFLESQDQLWIIKSAPKGVTKFVKARLTEALLLGVPLAILPSVVVSIITGLGIGELLLVLGNTYVMICGGVLVATGITANNPSYENTKSSAFTTNKMVSMLIISFTPQGILFTAIFFRAFWIIDNIAYFILANSLPIIFLGLVLCFIGTRRLARSEKV
ncbi:MAG: hypothetical protein ACE5R6_12055 [Candidatus Heimdallarchaeota archaeon]